MLASRPGPIRHKFSLLGDFKGLRKNPKDIIMVCPKEMDNEFTVKIRF
jgi:hypothetical protein